MTPRRSHFLPAKVVMLLFRGKLLDALRELHRRGQLRLPDAMSPERFASLLNRLGRKVKWNVRVCERYAHGRGVSLYLARYVKGGPYRNTQIVRASPREVLFRYTPNSEAGEPKRSATLALVAGALPRPRAPARPRAGTPHRALLRAVRACLRRATQRRPRAARPSPGRATRSPSTGRPISRASRARWRPPAARSVSAPLVRGALLLATSPPAMSRARLLCSVTTSPERGRPGGPRSRLHPRLPRPRPCALPAQRPSRRRNGVPRAAPDPRVHAPAPMTPG